MAVKLATKSSARNVAASINDSSSGRRGSAAALSQRAIEKRL
jgi:hypothetical protein